MRYSRHIGHGHLRELFDAPLHDVLRQLAHIHERPVVSLRIRYILFQCKVQVEYGDVRSAGLHRLGTDRIFRKTVHGSVYLLVHLDEGQVRIRAELERQPDDTRPVPRLAPQFAEARYLHELPAHGSHHRVLQFACRSVLAAHLDGNLRNVDVRKERYRQRKIRHQPDDETGRERHEHRYRSMY